jgi:F0F1-type ATP synthase gamma subunit
LTRVTRIFQKNVFTETTPDARPDGRAGFFVARPARAAARGGFLVFAKNREIQESTAMQFQKGQSGNPSGRPRGALNRATGLAQELLSARVESIAGKLIELAEGGDMRAIRVCMDRLMPAIKHQPIAVELPPIEKAADSVEAAASIVAAVAAGELTATEAAELAKVIDTYVGALATRGFDEREAVSDRKRPSLPEF